MGVCPLGAQVRQRCGRWLSPLSSIKTRMRPSFSAFFLALATPASSTGEPVLHCAPGSPLGALRTPAQTHKNLPDMALVIAHNKPPTDQTNHPGTGPQRSL